MIWYLTTANCDNDWIKYPVVETTMYIQVRWLIVSHLAEKQMVHVWVYHSLFNHDYLYQLRKCIYYTPFAKSNGRFFQTQKSTWCLYLICPIFGRFMEYVSAVISYDKYIDFYYQPFRHRGLKATKVIFSKLSFNIIVNFMDWNLTDSDEILKTLILTRCLNLV